MALPDFGSGGEIFSNCRWSGHQLDYELRCVLTNSVAIEASKPAKLATFF
jgi:hypothetical protein